MLNHPPCSCARSPITGCTHLVSEKLPSNPIRSPSDLRFVPLLSAVPAPAPSEISQLSQNPLETNPEKLGFLGVSCAHAAAAKAAIEEAGYTLGSDGIYEKDGQDLNLNICYYPARSLDSLALLIQEQLKAIGVGSYLTSQEDADATYILSGDYDIALYCMIADKNGDPYYFIDTVLRPGGYWASAGFESDEANELIAKLQVETDSNERARLANEIVQLAIDDNAIGCVGLFNKITVSAKNVSGIYENCPFDFYRIDADTDM